MFWIYFSYCGIQPYLALYVWSFQYEVFSEWNPCLPALSEYFGMYSLHKEWFVAWHFTDALTDFDFLIVRLAGCSSLAGTTCLKPAVGALLLCVFFPWTVFCEQVFKISSISQVHIHIAGCWGGRTMATACLGICFPEPCVGWERTEITAPVNSWTYFTSATINSESPCIFGRWTVSVTPSGPAWTWGPLLEVFILPLEVGY